jgi:SAM-dependent methyltransferase
VFYRRNATHFFKDRHYLHKDFPDLVRVNEGEGEDEGGGNAGGGAEEEGGEGEGGGEEGSTAAASTISNKDSPSFSSPFVSKDISTQQQQQEGQEKDQQQDETLAHPQPHHRVLIEMGCGVGNAVFPLLESDPNLFVYALDFSPRAIALLKQHPLYVGEGQEERKGEINGQTHTHTQPRRPRRRCQAYVCDVVNEPLPLQVANADLCLLMYSLSAMDPETLPGVVEKIYKVCVCACMCVFMCVKEKT